MNKRIIFKCFICLPIFSSSFLQPNPASATPININLEGVVLSATSETALDEPFCPPGIACDFLPGVKSFIARVAIAQDIKSTNALDIALQNEYADSTAELINQT